jgi:tetratricopeptide (TPR) repeat protein
MIVGQCLGLGIALSTHLALAASESVQSLERKIQTVLAEKAGSASDAADLIGLADLYLDLGDERTDAVQRRLAYEEGARFAEQALAIQENSAKAHYLYAANLGSAAQIRGVMASALTITELKSHVRRALELQPTYPAALHMMGMMCEELPWFLGGDAGAALTYLQQAASFDPTYVHARLDLARAYVKRHAFGEARRELSAILDGLASSNSSDADRRHREEASTLLKSLQGR